jgi:hypothetical protein
MGDPRKDNSYIHPSAHLLHSQMPLQAPIQPHEAASTRNLYSSQPPRMTPRSVYMDDREQLKGTQPGSMQASHTLASPPTARALSTSTGMPQQITGVDYQGLLLALAEEYLDTARKLGPKVTCGGQGAGLSLYQRLIATALGCLEAVLQVYSLHPHAS